MPRNLVTGGAGFVGSHLVDRPLLPDDGRVASNFIVQALRCEPLTLYGDGSHSRPMNMGEFTIRQLA